MPDTVDRPPFRLGVRRSTEGAVDGSSYLNIPKERPMPHSIHSSFPGVTPGAGFLSASAMVSVAEREAVRASVRVPDPFPPPSV